MTGKSTIAKILYRFAVYFNRFILLYLLVVGLLGFNVVYAGESEEWLCRVDGTDDQFRVDFSQRIYHNAPFQIFQLIDGLTVLVLNTETRRFNRLSNLNLLAHSSLDPERPAEPVQFFSGLCNRLEPSS
jgi:hypothetical protein